MTKKTAWAKVIKAAKSGNPEQVLRTLSTYFSIDADNETDDTVIAILRDLAEQMHYAAGDYYVSTK